MTSELKCPVCPWCNQPLHCGAELNVDGHNVEMWYCTNYECEESEDLIGTREMWEVFTNARHIFAQGQENTKELAIKLVQAKQDLEIATKALKELWQATHYDTDGYLGKTIQQAITQIEHKDKNNG